MTMTYTHTSPEHENPKRFISAVTDEVLRERDSTLEPLLVRYKDWLVTYKDETPRSDAEYTRDALTLGILWRCYGQRVIGMPAFYGWIFSGFRRLRRNVLAKDSRRQAAGGKLARQLLQLKSQKTKRTGLTSPCEIMALMFWLDAIGVYGDEVERLTPLCTFLVEIDGMESEWHLARLSAFTARVLMICEQKLPNTVFEESKDVLEPEKRHSGWLAALAGSPSVEEQYLRVLEMELMRRSVQENGAEEISSGGYSFEISPA